MPAIATKSLESGTLKRKMGHQIFCWVEPRQLRTPGRCANNHRHDLTSKGAEALPEYLQRRKQLKILDLFGAINYNLGYDYKQRQQGWREKIRFWHHPRLKYGGLSSSRPLDFLLLCVAGVSQLLFNLVIIKSYVRSTDFRWISTTHSRNPCGMARNSHVLDAFAFYL